MKVFVFTAVIGILGFASLPAAAATNLNVCAEVALKTAAFFQKTNRVHASVNLLENRVIANDGISETWQVLFKDGRNDLEGVTAYHLHLQNLGSECLVYSATQMPPSYLNLPDIIE